MARYTALVVGPPKLPGFGYRAPQQPKNQKRPNHCFSSRTIKSLPNKQKFRRGGTTVLVLGPPKPPNNKEKPKEAQPRCWYRDHQNPQQTKRGRSTVLVEGQSRSSPTNKKGGSMVLVLGPPKPPEQTNGTSKEAKIHSSESGEKSKNLRRRGADCKKRCKNRPDAHSYIRTQDS